MQHWSTKGRITQPKVSWENMLTFLEMGIHGILGLLDALEMRFVDKVALHICKYDLFLKGGRKWTVELCFLGKAQDLQAMVPSFTPPPSSKLETPYLRDNHHLPAINPSQQITGK